MREKFVFKITINNKLLFWLDRVISYSDLVKEAGFHPHLAVKIKYFNSVSGKQGTMGPVDLIKIKSGMRFLVT